MKLSRYVALLMVVGTMAEGQALAAEKLVSIGTGGLTGAYYPAGGAICRLVNRGRKEHNIRCSVESTGGSIANLNGISRGDLDMGVVQSDWQYNAYEGTGIFAEQGANKKLRSLFSLHSEMFTVVARKDKNINKFEDLKGHKISIGNAGSGVRATMEEVMKAEGWKKNVFTQLSELSPEELPKALCEGKIDAIVFATGHPNGDIKTITDKCNTQLIPVTGPAIDKLLQEHSYYAQAIIPAKMYSNPEDVKTFGIVATVVATEDTNEEIVYQMTKAVFDNFDSFKTLHFVFKDLDKNHMIKDGLTAPLHPGALRYYREAGLLKE